MYSGSANIERAYLFDIGLCNDVLDIVMCCICFDDLLIHRMDPKSSYLLEIKLDYPKRRRPEFSYYNFTKVVDSDICNFKDLVSEIVDEFPHGYNDIVTVFYYDDANKNILQVKTDQELLAMFGKHVDSKVLRMTITYTEPIDIVPTSFSKRKRCFMCPILSNSKPT